MNSKKLCFVMLGVLAIILGGAVAATVYGTKSLKSTGDELLELKLVHEAFAKDEESLAKAKQDIEKYSELEQVAKAIVPQEKDQARTVRELVAIASQAGVQFDSITFPASTLGLGQTQSGKSKQPAAPSGITQLTPVEGLTGVYAMPITLQSSVDVPITYAQLLDFLHRIEQNRRTSHVTNISISPIDDNRSLVSFTLQINAYIKP